ncbi:pyridoxamine 5'-phosphate oxidase family protein [Deinococcus apachensis]|uniref:pyridoxamine 5'-phosphate oxidase family protein n=1 Tax=Deinococcus apachensis TaxID=309886 RepID=UPI00036DE10E|nr:pyridoxamine 5'-phosphate oxidase family protein [Deinococcus apachensis]
MAKQFDRILPEHAAFIARQPLFFTGSAAPGGRVNISPKGLDTLRLFGDRTAAYLDLTGSGNETAAHLRLSPRLTLMFCAFEGPPLILRLYGTARVLALGTPEFGARAPTFTLLPGTRQIVELDVDLVQTSCGFGVPLLDFREDRSALTRQAEAWGEDGLRSYWERKNQQSIDGFPTGLLERSGDASPASEG